jgi:hypothetical protein
MLVGGVLTTFPHWRVKQRRPDKTVIIVTVCIVDLPVREAARDHAELMET